MAATQFDVFLSHNSQDKPAVLSIARALQEEGLEPWLDSWYLRGGDRWQQVLGDALRASAACAFFYGAHGLGNWHEAELEVAQDRANKDATFRLIPVLLPGTPAQFDPGTLPPFLSTRMWVDLRSGVDDPQRLRDLIVAINGARGKRDESDAETDDRGVVPYRGLHTFDEEHAEFFFGREADVQRLLEKLKGSRFLAVVGPSGSGKSSLVRAGLLPALRRDGLPGSGQWQMCVVKPGANPLETLAAHLINLGHRGAMQQTIDQLGTDARTLHLGAALGLIDRPPDVRLLWVIDQAEEVFTLCRDDEERQAFLDNLLYAASVPDGRCAVVLTLRADFYPRLAAYPELALRLGTDQYLVSPLEEQGLRDAIEKPAARVGLTFEPGLVETILEDVQSQPGALPLLEHALLELWERRRGRTMTLAAYQEIGGVSGALAKRADESFEALTPEQQAIARRAMLRLTQPGEGTEDTRRRAEFDELATRPEQRDEVQRVVDALVAARLLTTSGDEQTGAQWVDVAHEALIRGWPRLRAWLDEDRQFLVVHRRLTEAAHDWQQNERDPDLLYRGARLAEALLLADQQPEALNALERAFLAESEAVREGERAAAAAALATRERMRRRVVAGSLLATVVALALAALAGLGWREAQEQTAVARGAQSEALSQAAVAATESARAEEEAARAEAAAAVAAEEKSRAEGEAAAAAAARATAEAAAVRAEDEAARAEAEAAAAAIAEEEALSRQLAAQSRLGDRDLGLLLAAEAFDLNPDDADVRGSLLAATREQPWLDKLLHGHDGVVYDAVFHPEGAWLASGGLDGLLRLWNPDTGQVEASIDTGGTVATLAVHPDGGQIATGSTDGTIRLWDWEPNPGFHAGPELATAPGIVEALTYSADGRLLASAVDSGMLQVWDVATGEALSPAWPGHEDDVFSLAFTPDGSGLISAGMYDGEVRFWDVASREALGAPLTTLQSGMRFAITPDGATLATAGDDGSIILWDRQTRLPIGTALLGHAGGVPSMTFSSDGAILLSGGVDGTIRQWDVATRLPVGGPLATGQGPVYGIAVNPAAPSFAAVGSDETIRLGSLKTEQFGPFLPLAGHSGLPSALAHSPDGRMIATGGSDGAVILWDVETGVQRGAPLLGHSAGITSLAFSPESDLLASAGMDGTVRLWDPDAGGAPRATLVGHSGLVNEVVFNPSGELLATVGADGTIRLWRASDGVADGTPLQDTNSALSVAFNPEGTVLATANLSGWITLWDVETRQPLHEAPVRTGQGAVWAVRFVRNGTGLVSAGADGTLRYWDASDSSSVGEAITAHDGTIASLVVNGDGTLLASSGQDGSVRLWEVGAATPGAEANPVDAWGWKEVAFSPDGTRLAHTGFPGTNQAQVALWDIAGSALAGGFPIQNIVSDAVLSADGSRLVWAGLDGRVVVQEVATSDLVAEQRMPPGTAIWSVAISPDGSRVAIGEHGGAVRLWDIDAATSVGPPLPGQTDIAGDLVMSLAFNRDGSLLAAGSFYGTVRVWDTATGQPVGDPFVVTNPLSGQGTSVKSLAFSPTQPLLALSGWQTITLWDVEQQARAGPPLAGHALEVTAVAFSPDGRLLASGASNGEILVWDVASRQPWSEPMAGSPNIEAMAFSPAGDLLVTGSFTGVVQAWSLADRTASALGDLSAGDNKTIRFLAFSADGQGLSAIDWWGAISGWDMAADSWRQRACAVANRNLTHAEWQRYLGTSDDNERPYTRTCPELPLPADEAAAATPAVLTGTV